MGPEFFDYEVACGGKGISKVVGAREVIKQVKEKVARNAEMWDEVEAGLPQQEELLGVQDEVMEIYLMITKCVYGKRYSP